MNRNGRVTGIELLQLAFIVLKLCKVIKWSWLWVLSPTWISIIIFIIVLIIGFRSRKKYR